MSAYALPGLFPPLEPSFRSERASPQKESSSESHRGHSQGPLHEQNESSRIAEIFQASVGRFYPGSAKTTEASPSSQDNTHKESLDGPGIAVKDAKIDPVRLVEYLTGTGQRCKLQQQRKTLRRRNSPEAVSPVGRKQVCKLEASDSPHDEAIQFELSISLDGRKYTATRSLQCIVQLRNDLIHELSSRKRWLHGGSRDMNDNQVGGEEDEVKVFQIPEIPPLSGEESGGSGLVGRGFTMLHAMVTSYVPVMERWLRNVMAVVPQDSESLSNFLWEPSSTSDSVPSLALEGLSGGSLSALGSIKEMDYKTDDDDDSDDEEDDRW